VSIGSRVPALHILDAVQGGIDGAVTDAVQRYLPARRVDVGDERAILIDPVGEPPETACI
jgi:hypothetical protein